MTAAEFNAAAQASLDEAEQRIANRSPVYGGGAAAEAWWDDHMLVRELRNVIDRHKWLLQQAHQLGLRMPADAGSAKFQRQAVKDFVSQAAALRALHTAA